MTLKIMGIYKIVNITNEKVYVGSSINILSRKRWHWSMLDAKKHHAKRLQAAWLKYGEEAFRFEILEECDLNALLVREQFWIDFYEAASFSKGYNSLPTAGTVSGRKMSDETKNKLRLANLGKKASPEARAKMSASHMGVRKGRTGKSPFLETRAKMSAARKGSDMAAARLASPANKKGKVLSVEYRKKISESLKGRPVTDAQRAHLANQRSIRLNKLKQKEL